MDTFPQSAFRNPELMHPSDITIASLLEMVERILEKHPEYRTRLLAWGELERILEECNDA